LERTEEKVILAFTLIVAGIAEEFLRAPRQKELLGLGYLRNCETIRGGKFRNFIRSRFLLSSLPHQFARRAIDRREDFLYERLRAARNLSAGGR